jgi:hypothetical protein
MRFLRLSTALAFIFAGLVGLIGCIWIPGNYQRSDGQPRPETRIGRAGGDKPLQLMRATRADVERVIGPPNCESADHRVLFYEYRVNTAFWLLCFVIPYTNEEGRHLRLDFNEQGRLASYKVFKDESEAKAGIELAPPPPHVRPANPKAPHG